MRNREVYLKDPAEQRLLNDGVVTVSDARSVDELRVLRYELETFVCDGEYADGLRRVIESFLGHLDDPQQTGIWVSGFFGSGKSHFIKMLRYLWVDFRFPDGATARGLAKLPQEVADPLRELSAVGKRLGRLHAVSGTLSSGAGDNVRLALLGLVFRSVGLSSQYPIARFEMWLRGEGLLDRMRAAVESRGKSWDEEMLDLYVSGVIASALLEVHPSFANDEAAVHLQLRTQFPIVGDVSTDDMVQAIKKALIVDGKFPLTVVALDEVQQYIGELPRRSSAVLEVTETCERAFGSRMLFVGTGQSALSATPMLTRLMARFPVAIELSDSDVDRVIRKVILAKKPDSVAGIQRILAASLGEISRHLAGTRLEHRPEDVEDFVADYPLLPVRRRFWERVLRSVDQAGTASQLRNQLKVVHEAVQLTGDEPLGTVVPGDYVYDSIAPNLLQTAVLPREIYEYVRKLTASGDPSDRLKARLCGLVFLIGKLPRDPGSDLGVRSTPDSLVDLLVEDLPRGSSELRKIVPELLGAMEADGHLMLVEDEFRVQTRESAAWNDEYRRQLAKVMGDPQRIAQERSKILRRECGDRLKVVRLLQGACKEPRALLLDFGPEQPKETDSGVSLWIRDGWDEEEAEVVSDARAAGNESILVFLYLPKRSPDEIKKNLAAFLAASATLDVRGVPATPEGHEARNAMETRRVDADRHVREVLDEVFGAAKVLQGGGQEISASSLVESVKKAAENALVRMFPKFGLADHTGWPRVLLQAKGGNAAALEAIGYRGDPEQHPVIAELRRYVAGGKKGSEIRRQFTGRDYGWPQDAIDGALYVLLVSGLLWASDSANKPVDAAALDRAKVANTTFHLEGVTITALQRIAIRKLFQEVGVTCRANEELQAVPMFLEAMHRRARSAGGDPPRPTIPEIGILSAISALAGNEQLLAIYNDREQLGGLAKRWDATAALIAQRMPVWVSLSALLNEARSLPEVAEIKKQADAIDNERLLLANPDVVPSLAEEVAQLLRDLLLEKHQAFEGEYEAGMRGLAVDPNWLRLVEGDRARLLASHGVANVPSIATGTVSEILQTLAVVSLEMWDDRRAALGRRFSDVRLEAAKLLEPRAVRVELPSRTLTDETAVKTWVQEVETTLLTKVKEGPVVV